MDSLTELVDLIADRPDIFAPKIAWISSRCPPPAALNGGASSRVTRSHLHALLALARLLSKCPSAPSAPLLDFLRAVPSAALRPSFWPHSSSPSAFFTDLLRDLSLAAASSPALAADLSSFFGGAVITVALHAIADEDPVIAKAFLTAVSRSCPAILPDDAERLVGCLLDQIGVDASPEETMTSISIDNYSSWSSSAQTSPTKGKQKMKEEATEVVEDGASSESGARRSSVDQSASSESGGGGQLQVLRTNAGAFEDESVEELEKQEIAFRMFGQVLDKVGKMSAAHTEQVRKVATKQLKSLSAFLKIRKRDWREQGPLLKARINTKLSCCQAAIGVQVKIILSLDSDGKASKDASRRALALLLEVAESCIVSPWRKLRITEELFSVLLSGISQMTVCRGGQLLRVLLIPLKPLVQSTCAQACFIL